MPLLKIIIAVALFLLLIDGCLFRTGAYSRVIKMESTAGSVVNATMEIKRYFDPSRKNILVLGTSQISEGFSARVADAATERADLHFINGSIAGTTPRVWSYLLRKVDPNANRFAAVALMVDYELNGNKQDLTNYPLDTNYLVPLLGVRDIADYPSSFTRVEERQRARRAILFPLQTLHDDVRDLLLHPLQRQDDVTNRRRAWLEAVGDYQGQPSALPQLTIDPVTHRPTDWKSESNRIELEPYFEQLRMPPNEEIEAANSRYRAKWIGDIAKRYRDHGIPVIVFVVPRGPWHRDLAPVPVPAGAIADMIANNDVVAIPGDAFIDLEQPQYFFDMLHMNHAGLERFSREFGQRVAPLIR